MYPKSMVYSNIFIVFIIEEFISEEEEKNYIVLDVIIFTNPFNEKGDVYIQG